MPERQIRDTIGRRIDNKDQRHPVINERTGAWGAGCVGLRTSGAMRLRSPIAAQRIASTVGLFFDFKNLETQLGLKGITT